MIISINGIIGSGKTSIVKCLELLGCAIREEPHSRNLVLEEFLKSDESRARLGFLTQICFLSDRFIDMTSLQAEVLVTGKVGVLDSSVASDECFQKMLAHEWHPLEVKVYEKIAKIWRGCSNLVPDLAFFLSVDPQVCLQRIMKRAEEIPDRKSETGYTLDYLTRLQKSYLSRIKTLGREVVILSPDSPKRYERLYDDPLVNAKNIMDFITLQMEGK